VQPPRPDNGAAGARRFEFGRALQRATTEQAKTEQAKTEQAKTDQPTASSASQGEEVAAAAPPVTAEPPREPPAKLPEAIRPADPLDALEEEMAKLLGRPPGQS